MHVIVLLVGKPPMLPASWRTESSLLGPEASVVLPYHACSVCSHSLNVLFFAHHSKHIDGTTRTSWVKQRSGIATFMFGKVHCSSW